ncbi:phosphotransferase [Paractinoplanes deccanensis]|uniref:Phosphotransferase n=1 Tax=Paractinoplanes deccanensis TaxID=113561 RepID=A0ABQ3XV16_9ACTN|nr:aminoglycoside phosphotransferase family protein [Actinoplanes deccanensis]GID71589.1 phosphotransferase [Actinoplanes deccanensis]
MRSPTQPVLAEPDIASIVREALGASLDTASELGGGGFAAVWLASLTDGRRVVVKVAPPASARLLSYERELIPAEAVYFGAVAGLAPVPEVLAVSPGWIVTTHLPGRPLTEADAPRARHQLGAAVRRIHTLTGDHFGYTGDRPAGPDWPTAFTAIMQSLRSDAASWGVPLPPALDGAVERHTAALAAVTTPALLHFDLWDGNVLASPAGELTGLVDGERYLYGDPLLDLVSPALFRRIEEEPDHPFLAGYDPGPLDRAALIRLALYRIHLYTLMLTEGPSRGIAATDGRQTHVTALLDAELEHLDAL